jgi:glycosyltransferase involved in cell wall biosynthesis
MSAAVATIPPEGPRPRPIVSVVVTAYRRRQYLLDAVRSIVSTSVDPSSYEVVVVKDFSDPAMDDALRAIGSQVRLVTVDLPRMGDSLARGIEESRGRVLAFLEDDDRFLSGKLAGVIERFRADPNLGFLRNAYRAIDAEGRPVEGWERFRPAPPRGRSFDPRARAAGDLPWLYRFSPNVNVSTMAIARDVVQPWLEPLRSVTAALDSFLFTTALVSDRSLRVESERWNEYRVHASLSHSAISDTTGELDLRDTARSLPTAERMVELVARRPGHPLAARFSRAFRLEVEVNIFLLDPRARLGFRDWLAFLSTAVGRRQKYLLVPWVYCLYRWISPRGAVESYRRRRSGTLRAAAEVSGP